MSWWWNGRHVRFRCVWRNPCGFKSHSGHYYFSEKVIIICTFLLITSTPILADFIDDVTSMAKQMFPIWQKVYTCSPANNQIIVGCNLLHQYYSQSMVKVDMLECLLQVGLFHIMHLVTVVVMYHTHWVKLIMAIQNMFKQKIIKMILI